MVKEEIEIPEGYEAKIVGNKVVLELKESEDERILNALITHISIYEGDFTTVGVTRLEMLDWLEKLKKQKEQKPAEYINITQKILDYIDEDSRKYKNKRPVLGDVWTVTKKCTYPNVLNGKPVVEVEKDGFGWMRLPEEIVEVKNGQEKPAEWSEEDENYLEEIISDLKFCKKNRKSCKKDLIEDCIDWLNSRLKSLHPQPHWKPSDEQMEALLWCTAHLGDADHRVLAELYEHLKMYCL